MTVGTNKLDDIISLLIPFFDGQSRNGLAHLSHCFSVLPSRRVASLHSPVRSTGQHQAKTPLERQWSTLDTPNERAVQGRFHTLSAEALTNGHPFVQM